MGTHRGRRPRRPNRLPARRILVVTEGTVTEPQYVEGLNGFLRSAGATAVVKPVAVGKDPVKVVRRCIEERDPAAAKDKGYDECVCLVDVDQHDTLPGACRIAARESVILLISNLKFEVWLRWHAEDRRSALSTSRLDARMAELGLVRHKRLAADFPFDAVDAACAIARQADPDLAAGRKGPDPSSAMPVLVDLLRGPAA